MTDVILDVSHIAKTFGHVQALKDITLSLRKGRVHTLLGENGAGKSTLMKILAGVYPPTQGTITLRGETITITRFLRQTDVKPFRLSRCVCRGCGRDVFRHWSSYLGRIT